MENVKLEEKKKSNTEDIRKLSYAFEKTKVRKREIKHYVPVAAVNEISIQRHMQGSTVLVHGPGKTTVMQVALHGVEGIVHIQPSPLEVENLYNSILSTVGFKAQDKACDTLVISALNEMEDGRN